MLDKFLKYFVATFLLISGFAVKAQIPGTPSIPGMGGGKSTSTVDLKAGKNDLVKAFFVSFENYAQSLDLLTQSLGLDADSKKIQQALADSKNPNTSESDRMANALKATTETTKALEEKNKAGTIILDVKAKEKYAKSIPFAVKGLIGTLELKPKTTQMVSSIQANPIMAAQDLGALAKVIPEVPNYITTIVSVTKLIVTGAEANNIDTKELKSTLGKF
jgi:hypothetical protein